MAGKKTHAIFYKYENFIYLNETRPRVRPTVAIALIGTSRTKAPDLLPAGLPSHGPKKKSIAIYSVENVSIDVDDWFLPGHDGGHLIAASLGGGDESINRVPMALDENRGGGRRDVEKLVKDLPWGAFRVSCEYNDGIDPRIPVRINGAAYALRQDQVETAIANKADPTPLLAASGLRGSAQITQDPFHVVPPTVRYSTAGAKLQQLFDDDPLPDGWRIETSGLTELQVSTNGLEIGNSGKKVSNEWLLPPVNARPNAWFDYLALRGHLKEVVADVLNKKYVRINAGALNTHYDSAAVPGEYRNLLMVWNGIYYQYQLSGQKIYRCEATDDSGMGNLGFTAAPEIDHIIPSSQSGPTLFSNLRVTSREYNTSRGNRASATLLNNGIWVGKPTIMRKRRGDEATGGPKHKGFYRD